MLNPRYCLCVLILALLGGSAAAAGGGIAERLDTVLAPSMLRDVHTGILYDRVLPLSPLDRFHGSPSGPPATLSDWRQMVSEIRRASLDEPALPSVFPSVGGGVIPLAVLNYAYERIRPEAIGIRNGRIFPIVPPALETRRVFAATALRDRTYRGSEVRFQLDPDNYLTNDPAAPVGIAVDFADGRGFVPLAFSETAVVRYVEPGSKVLRLRITMEGGRRLEASFVFEVHRLRTPSPHDTLDIQATISYLGGFGSGEAYVYLAEGHSQIIDPVVVIEGFDLDNSMNWDELYELLNREELVETLRARGFDLVLLNFNDAVDYLQRNAFVAVELIEQVREIIGPTRDMAVAGASMGGLIGRYALAYMEAHARDHAVRTFISFDAPQTGAIIPLGLQYWLWFFADESEEAAALLAALDSPAARQLLLYHHTDPPSGTGESDPLHDGLWDDFAALGDYPSLPRKVAIINGSAAAADQGFLPGDQIIEWEYSSILLDVTGNVWAVPDGTPHMIFHGEIDIILLPPDEETVNVSATLPYDGAPGGWRGSMAQLDTTEAPYGDIVGLHDHHCFIPSISGLALNTGDLFYDIAGDPDLLDHTPFDAVYYPLENEEHVEITPANAEWFLAEIEFGTSGVAAASPAPLAWIAPPSPHPLRPGSGLRFSAPMAGEAHLDLHDATGRRVAQLLDHHVEAGTNLVLWEGGRPGVYFLRLTGPGYAASQKVIVR